MSIEAAGGEAAEVQTSGVVHPPEQQVLARLRCRAQNAKTMGCPENLVVGKLAVLASVGQASGALASGVLAPGVLPALVPRQADR